MMKSRLFLLSLALTPLIVGSTVVNAADAKVAPGRANVKVESSDTTNVVDPEDPDVTTDPTTEVSTKGNLRFDHLPSIDFGEVKIAKSNRTFNALAETIKQGSRASFIQITDYREKSTGWVVQVKQDYQFKTVDNDELKGAVLSVDKGWANSTSSSPAPTVTRNTLSLTNIGQVYEVARAAPGQGRGIWSISFGSSGDNDDGQSSTLSDTALKKKTAGEAKSTIEKKTNQLKNSAVTLNIPDGTPIVPKEYQTKFTWIISSTP